AARTIAERGVQLIGTAHGNTLDNLMLNPTLSDLIGGIQSVTLGDEEARRRRSQKSVLERKAPPTFDVIIEIQDREKVLVHADVADTVDAMLRGDPVAPELRWRDDEGVHRSASRPRPSPREQLAPDRFSGLIGAGGSGWRTEPGWRGDGGGYRGGTGGSSYLGGGGDRGTRPGFRPGASGSWRPGRSGGAGAPGSGGASGMPGGSGGGPRNEAPFVAGDIADRGPVERGAAPLPEPRAREARELSRQREWRDSATKAITTLRAEEGTGPVNVAELEARDAAAVATAADDADDEALMDRAIGRAMPRNGTEPGDEDLPGIRMPELETLPTLRLLPQGISRKRLEQAIRELQLPVIIAHDVDEADVVMTIRSEYKQKTPMVREAEERAMPIYVLKTNTIPQMQASLTSIFALEVDPRDAALRETEEAIGLVLNRAEAVELSPQNAYIRRLQHQLAERANLVSRSRGREPYRRVRLYPDPARSPWR
ncbi:MAG TPA: R3H domain-containing nucleic acid-binding protein, partial [Candidatus Limnocylindrales bacterium]|nr:R3H domain-containing nucleic acid-binding protein [Candidatus Limnocylindrales bacterium]